MLKDRLKAVFCFIGAHIYRSLSVITFMALPSVSASAVLLLAEVIMRWNVLCDTFICSADATCPIFKWSHNLIASSSSEPNSTSFSCERGIALGLKYVELGFESMSLFILGLAMFIIFI